MVRALKEIWRVLVPKGVLIDLRPIAGNSPVEIVAGGQVLGAGLVDESLDIPNDIAANKSVARVVHERWFSHERDESFKYALYWDNLEEMKAYAEERWTNSRLPEEVLAEAHRLVTSSDEDTRIRVRLNIIIARYRKRSSVPGKIS